MLGALLFRADQEIGAPMFKINVSAILTLVVAAVYGLMP